MSATFTYQQDTIKTVNLLKLNPDLVKTDTLQLQRTPISLDSLPVRQVAPNQVQNQAPTQAQIRYWQRQRESKLLVDGLRFMKPKEHVQLVSTAQVNDRGLGLPAHEINRTSTDWLTILLLLVLVLFATVRTSYSKYLVNLFQSLFNYSTSFRMYREKNYSALHAAFRLEVYFYITFSVFLFQVINYFHIHFRYSNFMLYLFCFGAVLAYFLIKKLTYFVVGLVFEDTNETSEYLFNMDNYNRAAGIFLFPIITLVAFYPAEDPTFPMFLGGLTVFAFYILLLQRGIAILLKKQFSIFYLFLYLCSLEFLPLLLIYKIVVV
jgi:hypothetical protein